MAENSKIEWTDATWNPIRGCSRVSEGCRNCYAERVAMRFSGKGQPYEGLVKTTNGHPQWTGKVELVPEHVNDPLKWKTPRRVFVNSMSDLFHENLADDLIAGIFLVMAACAPGSVVSNTVHTFQVLTKRPERMRRFITEYKFRNGKTLAEKPLPNVWLGVSCEDQATADERIPLLLQTPATVRWVSAEPLLGPIDLTAIKRTRAEGFMRPLDGRFRRLDWVVCGGESGPNARPMHPDWARSLRDQCQVAGVPFFFKQWGEWIPALDQKLASSWSAANDQDFRPKKFRMMGRLAKEGEPIFGGRKFQSCTLGSDMALVSRVGKKAAGRLLDGREWNEYPEVRA